MVLELVQEREAQREAGWRQGRSRARAGGRRKSTAFLLGYVWAVTQGSVALVASGTEVPSQPGITWRSFDRAGGWLTSSRSSCSPRVPLRSDQLSLCRWEKLRRFCTPLTLGWGTREPELHVSFQ